MVWRVKPMCDYLVILVYLNVIFSALLFCFVVLFACYLCIAMRSLLGLNVSGVSKIYKKNCEWEIVGFDTGNSQFAFSSI